MSEYAVMPLADYDATCDKVREKVGEQTILFEKTDFGYLRSAVFTVAKTGQYMFSFEFSDPSKFDIYSLFYNVPEWEGETSPGFFESIDNNNATAYLSAGQQYRIFISDHLGLTPEDILKATLSIDGEVVVDFVPPLTIKSGEMADRVEDVFDAGKQAERDAFWDKVQNYGKRTDYSYSMGGQVLVDSGYLPPKYPMVLSDSLSDNYYMFGYFNREGTEPYDMTEICKLLDCSKAKRLVGFLSNGKAKNITFDISACTNASYMFDGSMIGCRIDNISLKVTEALTYTGGMFSYCASLKTLRFTEDSVINVAIAFPQSNLLSAESVDSIIHALKDLTGQTAKKITFHTDVVGRMTEEQKSKILAKNWQIG